MIDLYQQGVDSIERSSELIEEGEFTAALWDRVLAAACGYLALETGRCRYTYATRGYAGLVARLRDNAWLAEEVNKAAARLKTRNAAVARSAFGLSDRLRRVSGGRQPAAAGQGHARRLARGRTAKRRWNWRATRPRIRSSPGSI